MSLGSNPRFNIDSLFFRIVLKFNIVTLLLVGEVLINRNVSQVTSQDPQSFGDTHKGSVCACVFIG